MWNEEKGDWLEPADNWGELRFSSAAPEAGAEWTDDGQIQGGELASITYRRSWAKAQWPCLKV